jgi:hypothetical protein
MREQVRPVCPDPVVAEGLRGRSIKQGGTRRCHQGSKGEQTFTVKPDRRMYLSLVRSISLRLDIPGGSIDILQAICPQQF